jgi:hypothetical protein
VADKRLIHDHAWATAAAVVRLFAGCLREEEQVEAFHEVYELLKSELAAMLTRRDREMARLGAKPRDHNPPTQ